MANVKIVMTDHGRGSVFVDGVKINPVRAVEFRAEADGSCNRVTLTLIPEQVEIEGPADVTIPEMMEVTTHDDPEPRYVPISDGQGDG